MFGEIP